MWYHLPGCAGKFLFSTTEKEKFNFSNKMVHKALLATFQQVAMLFNGER
jgi:hypothetical protein